MQKVVQLISTQAQEWDVDQAQEPSNKLASHVSQVNYVGQTCPTKKSQVHTSSIQKENPFVGKKELGVVEPVK